MSAHARGILIEAGYEAAFSAIRGQVRSDPGARYTIPRHHTDLNWPMKHMQYFARGGMELR